MTGGKPKGENAVKYAITIPTGKEEEEIDDGLMVYNLRQVPPTQEDPFVKICRCAKDTDGKLIGGVLACSVLWGILQIVTVWVEDAWRGQGVASRLLEEVEVQAGKTGCHLAQLDTFDFQAREFYEKRGYQVFGTLKDAPRGHSHYYMFKNLDKN